ncbi:MAG TPA: DUF418 domain-containing protein [Gemmatimonadaceae bacterium]
MSSQSPVKSLSRSPRGASPSAEAPRQVLERIPVLDVLRGFAMLGMIVAHLAYFKSTSGAIEVDPTSTFVDRTIELFFDGSFYAIFCILFGVGFAVQLARAEARGDRFAPRYLRRLLALAVFGFILDGIFRYNVLFIQAMWGLPLLFVCRWSKRRLIALLLLCAASRPLYDLGRLMIYSARPNGIMQLAAANQEAERAIVAMWEKVEAAEQTGDWRTVIAARFEFMPEYYRRSSFLPSENFTFFLLGLLAFRIGLFDRPERHRRLIASLVIAGLASWAVSLWVLPLGGPGTGQATVLDAAATLARTNAFMLVRKQWLVFAYMGAVLLLVARYPAWLERLAPLGWAGRMALTNYVLHVVLLEILFARHGLGLTVPASMVFASALLFFAGHVLVSRWWLSRYASGPLEWLWRWFTYWQRSRFRREVPAQLPSAMSA